MLSDAVILREELPGEKNTAVDSNSVFPSGSPFDSMYGDHSKGLLKNAKSYP